MIPLFFYPVKTVAVDDDKDFLNAINWNFSNQSLLTFDNPNEALTSLKDENPIQDFIPKRNNGEPELLDENAIFTDLDLLQDRFSLLEKYKHTAVVIVDYDMPEMDGLAFCENLTNKLIMKILLTGHVDDKRVINAFNNGVIDYFISKTQMDVISQIKIAIKRLQQVYFHRLSSYIAIPRDLDYSVEYKTLIEKFISDHELIEYVTIDSVGSYKGKDEEGNEHWFIIWPETKFFETINLARDQDADITLIEQLESRNHLLFFSSRTDEYLAPSAWAEKMLAVKGVLNFNNINYWYAIK